MHIHHHITLTPTHKLTPCTCVHACIHKAYTLQIGTMWYARLQATKHALNAGRFTMLAEDECLGGGVIIGASVLMPWFHHMALCYLLNQMLWLIVISSRIFAQLLFESSVLNSAVSVKSFVNVMAKDGRWRNPLPQGRWSGYRRQGVNLKRHCHTCLCNGYRARRIRALCRCWRGWRCSI